MSEMVEYCNANFDEIGSRDKNLFLSEDEYGRQWNPDSYGGVMHLGLVNQESRRAGTLVAPRVLIAATHFRPHKLGGKVNFSYSPNDYGECPLVPGTKVPAGTSWGYTLDGYDVMRYPNTAPTDILIMRSKYDLTIAGTPYPIADFKTRGAQRLKVIVLDGEKKAFTGEVLIHDNTVGFTRFDESLRGGDSGHPVFAVGKVGDKYHPILVGCHAHVTGFFRTGNFQDEFLRACTAWGVEMPVFVSSEDDMSAISLDCDLGGRGRGAPPVRGGFRRE